MQRNRAGQDVRAGEVFVEYIEKTGGAILDFARRATARSGRVENGSGRKMQFAGPRDGGVAYTESDSEVQNGNSV